MLSSSCARVYCLWYLLFQNSEPSTLSGRLRVVAQLVVPTLVHSEHLFCLVEFLRVVARFHGALYFFEQLKERLFSRSLVLCPLLHRVSEIRLACLHVGLEPSWALFLFNSRSFLAFAFFILDSCRALILASRFCSSCSFR